MADAIALAASCEATATAARDAVAWLGDPANADKVGSERSTLQRRFRRYAMDAQKLVAAVARPMCVGVFGPSQAGKSYLVSVLARPGERRLHAAFEGRPEGVDFIAEINPRGDKESTGLVTRFTIHPVRHPAGYPVCLRLLTQTDLVKVLANTFFLDGNLQEEPALEPAELKEALATARAAAQPKPVDVLIEDDLYDVRDYMERQFEATDHLRALTAFWDEAAELAPKLALPDRTKLLSLLWGRHEPFTRLFQLLVDALSKLGFAGDAFCRLDALIPREQSIIDVATLGGLGRPDQGLLQIRSFDGPAAELPRPMIAALTAELCIVCTERPWPFFDHTDLLDFPGARPRLPRNLNVFFAENADALKETFLRGKVAFLFDRYVADYELNAMLLCVRPSNMEVVSLPAMIDSWVSQTIGSTPEKRAGRPNTLFFVLTMFDTHFVEKAGEGDDDPGGRFANRLYASLEERFAAAHRWPKEWTPGQPFDNCFWLRNPNYPAESIIRYEGGREVEILPDKRDYVERLRQAHNRVPAVCAHFKDPDRAFEEALKFNDGGVSYLARALEPVCNPKLKYQQLAGPLAVMRAGMQERLARFHVADDIESRLTQRLEVAGQIVGELYRAADLREAPGERGRFGHVVAAMQMQVGELADLLDRMEAAPPRLDELELPPPAPAAGNGGTPPTTPMPAAPGGRVLPPGIKVATPIAPARQASREDIVAAVALRHWYRMLDRVPESHRLRLATEMSATALQELASELVQGVRRTGLGRTIASELARFGYIEKAEQSIPKAALLAAAHINRFVARLGMDLLPEPERPRVEENGTSRAVFALAPVVHDAHMIGAAPSPFTDRYVTDWAFAFVRLVEDNARSKEGLKINFAQNTRLGNILASLRAA